MQFHSETIWEKEVAYQRMTRHVDLVRAYLTDWKMANDFDRGNRNLFRKCLDNYAAYIRKYEKTITRDQIRDISNDVKQYDDLIYKLRKKRFKIKVEELDPAKYIQNLIEKNKSGTGKCF